jgi:hypothetical protein
MCLVGGVWGGDVRGDLVDEEEECGGTVTGSDTQYKREESID